VVVERPPDRPPFCDCGVFNDTIPGLSVPGNHEKWGRLEAAKAAVFYTLDLLGLPYGARASGFEPPLAFDFKADVIPDDELWRTMADAERGRGRMKAGDGCG